VNDSNFKMNARAEQVFIDKAFRNLTNAAEYFASRLRQNISHPGPPASMPGEFPHQATGELHDSIRVEGNRSDLSLSIIIDADHALAVEKKRPFISRTLLEEIPTMRRIATGGGS
jgi:hypothetical protein